MNSNAWMSKAIKSYAAIGILVVIAIIIAIATNYGDSTATATTSDKLAQDAKSAQTQLTVDSSSVDCNALVTKQGGKLATLSDKSKTPIFDVGAEHAVGNDSAKRLWSDGVNVPLDPQSLEAEQATVCSDPAQAAMVMNGIGSKTVGGKSVAQLNSWMVAQGSPSTISQWAQQCMTKTDVKVHTQCARTMSLTATLLGRFHSEGVRKDSTSWNYHLASGGLVVGKVPTFALNPKQEHNAYFLVISVTAKTGGCFLKLGFNVGTSSPNGGDQRLAGMTCVPTKPKSPPTSPPPGHHTPGCKSTHTCPTPPPGCKSTHTCPTPPPCTHKCNPPKTCKDLYGPGYGDKNGHSNGFPPCYKAAVVDGNPVVPSPPTNAPGPNPSPVPVTPSGSPSAIPPSNQCYDPETGLPVPSGTPGAWCS